ncbi:sigma-54-dependent Fis family transcriptional regulator [Noviherbaspirillum saxi]|uniref:Sigma-54-dependent Fis family transcriptional regulator n=1 Tax=Noviherbaspirillum saxi TaxID=2320863 RepID=A0A3A3FGW0_9BURK|nr:sigma-54-dependent Fis family transcriptional regulator [Noviherbaspirillum saxi]RJF92377.1 sigma-54-dependent Fis family transcriptional regulator [Noviherbaspirillum saxi]
MQHRQREHIATVIQVADHGVATPSARHHDEVIRSSWLRCVNEHRLDPGRMQEAVILPSERIREHQDQMEDFLHIARHGLETLYQQVAGMGYVVLLTDARGVTVDFLGDLQLDQSLRRAGLYLGSDWSERHAGTCGVGTCISTGEALTVHQGDHFDAIHIPLTCTSAPVYGAHGELNAVLDISALSSPLPKQSQHLALQLVKMYAHQIENAHFLHRYRHEWILRLSTAPQFLDVNPEYLLAVDAGGRVIGHNRRAELLFRDEAAGPLIGRMFDELFKASLEDLGRFVSAQPVDQRAITTAGNKRLLFLLASPPPARRMQSGAAGIERIAPAIPAPLMALSGGDPQLDRQIERVARLINSPVSLLITGETGTGKEYFAKAIHQSSERRAGPFIAVNCAAIPETLIESELFGYLPGSFSGAATRGKRGLIAEADGGTLFLDEIGDMPRALQARLLRVLAEKEVLPIGAARPVEVNIRVVAATHCDLKQLVREGRFRDDLYYRLNGAHISLPPLRDRHDLKHMMERMLRQHAKQHGQKTTAAIAPETADLLMRHDWPGNLRELYNVIQYAAAVCSHGVIQPDDLPEGFLDKTAAACPQPQLHARGQSGAVPNADAERLIKTLRGCRWNISATAQKLGIARMTLYRRMKRLGIETPNHLDDK